MVGAGSRAGTGGAGSRAGAAAFGSLESLLVAPIRVGGVAIGVLIVTAAGGEGAIARGAGLLAIVGSDRSRDSFATRRPMTMAATAAVAAQQSASLPMNPRVRRAPGLWTAAEGDANSLSS